jgi:hypothetical protein
LSIATATDCTICDAKQPIRGVAQTFRTDEHAGHARAAGVARGHEGFRDFTGERIEEGPKIT